MSPCKLYTKTSSEIIYHRLFLPFLAQSAVKLDHFWFHSKNLILMPTICNVSSCTCIRVCVDLLRNEYRKNKQMCCNKNDETNKLTWTWKPVAHLKISLVCCAHFGFHSMNFSYNAISFCVHFSRFLSLFLCLSSTWCLCAQFIWCVFSLPMPNLAVEMHQRNIQFCLHWLFSLNMSHRIARHTNKFACQHYRNM